MTIRTYDLFICHAWRYHESWVGLVDMLDELENFSWRNFSVPWHDPAYDANTPEGGAFVRKNLDMQVRPAKAVILPMDVYATRSARKWVDMEIELARKHGIPIIAVRSEFDDKANREGAATSDVTVPWKADEIAAAIQNVYDGAP